MPILFVIIGVANLLVAIVIGRTMPANWMTDFLSIVFRAFYHLDVKGWRTSPRLAPTPLSRSTMSASSTRRWRRRYCPRPPVFAIDVAMSRHWWIQPFLKFVRTMALDPLKPFSLRTIINAVRDDGDMLVIFPEGRITVTGSLMKIYDGAGMIADKSEAMLVPVHIDGPEATIFSRLTYRRCAAGCFQRSPSPSLNR